MKTKGVAFMLGVMSLGVAGLEQAARLFIPSYPNGQKATNRKRAPW